VKTTIFNTQNINFISAHGEIKASEEDIVYEFGFKQHDMDELKEISSTFDTNLKLRNDELDQMEVG